MPCIADHEVRSFRTAPRSDTDRPVVFAITGDLGQFEHSQETLRHMKLHGDDIDATLLVGDIAYTDFDQRRWDTFFDFLDDQSIFAQVPLMIAAGNHGKYNTSLPLVHMFVRSFGSFIGSLVHSSED